MYTPMTRKEREAEDRKKSLSLMQNTDFTSRNPTVLYPNNYNEHIKERSPLLPKDVNASLSYGAREATKRMKTEANRKRKQSLDDDGDDEEGSRDWWTKYFASVEEMINQGMYSVQKLYKNVERFVHLSDVRMFCRKGGEKGFELQRYKSTPSRGRSKFSTQSEPVC